MFTEAAGAQALNGITEYNDNLSDLSRVKYDEIVHTQVRRFIVVQHRREFCYAVPIFTYSGQGTNKPGVAAKEHSIAYSYGQQPQLVSGERPLVKDPICIAGIHGTKPLLPASRIYYGIQHPIQYNVKVKDLGYVVPDDTARFLGYWSEEHRSDTQQSVDVSAGNDEERQT